jgi:uncharacterized membrane protein
MPYALAYLASLVSFLAVDAVWLTLMNARLYAPILSPILSGKVDPLPAVLFYLIYIGGVTVFAVAPGLRDGGWVKAAALGAMLGFVAYATYDLTNAATLKVWAWKITLADMAWGSFATAFAAGVGCFVLGRLKA